MARVKRAMMTRKRRNKILKMAKGYWGSKSKHYKMANQAMMKSLTYAYIGRRLKKRDFRRLWITRISAACKANGMNYSTFMHGLKLADIQIDRKMLSELHSHSWSNWQRASWPDKTGFDSIRNKPPQMVPFAAAFFLPISGTKTD